MITTVEGLSSCEKLEKLDLTLNFISLASLSSSVEELKSNYNLRELYG